MSLSRRAFAGLLVASTIGVDVSPAGAQVIDQTIAPPPATYDANPVSWALIVGSAGVSAWNLSRTPLGRHPGWSSAGIALGLVATGFGKVTLDNGAASPDLAMAGMATGILSTFVSTISILPRPEDAFLKPAIESDVDIPLTRGERRALNALSVVAMATAAFNAATNLDGENPGLSAGGIGIGVISAGAGGAARSQSRSSRALANTALVSGSVSIATAIVASARIGREKSNIVYDDPTVLDARRRRLSTRAARIVLGRIHF